VNAWIRKWLFKEIVPAKNRFTIPERRRSLPSCRIRRYSESDFEACAAIYRANEGTHFPEGFFANFERLHTEARFRPLVLVAEVDQEVRAFGGITIQCGQSLANLSYGMVHPEHLRRGYGTAILFARLAALPEPVFDWTIALTTAGPSSSFYEQFGFRLHSRFKHPMGPELDLYLARFNLQGWTECFRNLWKSAIRIDPEGISVPERDLAEF
jgi:GNAT superfamily N-acetyltransferase